MISEDARKAARMHENFFSKTDVLQSFANNLRKRISDYTLVKMMKDAAGKALEKAPPGTEEEAAGIKRYVREMDQLVPEVDLQIAAMEEALRDLQAMIDEERILAAKARQGVDKVVA